MAIARNQITDYYRARKKSVPLNDAQVSQSPETNPEVMAEASINSHRIREAMSKLDKKKQSVIKMYLFEGWSYRDIGKVLNKSEWAIRVLKYRALHDLRRLLT